MFFSSAPNFGVVCARFDLKHQDDHLIDTHLLHQKLTNSLFPFLTNFKIEVSVDVKNTGKYDGDEVIQLYLHDVEASEKLPLKQLKAFRRISLKKGEIQTVSFKLCREDLSFWNSRNEFILEPGIFEIMIGAASDDVRQEIAVEVEVGSQKSEVGRPESGVRR